MQNPKTVVKEIDKIIDKVLMDVEETKIKANMGLFKTLSEAAMHLKIAKDCVYITIPNEKEQK